MPRGKRYFVTIKTTSDYGSKCEYNAVVSSISEAITIAKRVAKNYDFKIYIGQNSEIKEEE